MDPSETRLVSNFSPLDSKENESQQLDRNPLTKQETRVDDDMEELEARFLAKNSFRMTSTNDVVITMRITVRTIPPAIICSWFA